MKLAVARNSARATAASIANLPAKYQPTVLRARIEESQQREQTRLSVLFEARADRRKHGIKTAAELLCEVNNLVAALSGCLGGSDLDYFRNQLAELACEIEDGQTTENEHG